MPMKTWLKVALGIGITLAVLITVWIVSYQINKGVVTVQTGKVTRQDLTSVVTASGEVRPKTYTNVLGEGSGKVTQIVVKEGDHVKRGDVLLQLENIQPTADVQAQQANTMSSEAAIRVAKANFNSAKATLVQRQADFERAKFDWERGQELYRAQLIPKQDYDARKAAFDSSAAVVDAAQAQLAQMKAALEQSRSNLEQSRAILAHSRDILRKTTYRAPIDGLITYIAVRVGENVVPGIQNATGTYLMTISDMSVVTAEVKVDETDIVSVKGGQIAEVAIDAIQGKTFTGRVTEVGDQAILRSSGLSTTQTTANLQEAKDFKVVVTVNNPPDDLRPGLSATAKIRTAEKRNVLTIPIQALAIRSQKDLEEAAQSGKAGGTVTLAASRPAGSTAKDDVQGVFVIRGKKAEFVPVQTGITGVTDIEASSGLEEGDEIVIGSYKALRTLKPGATIKVDNSAPKREEESS